MALDAYKSESDTSPLGYLFCFCFAAFWIGGTGFAAIQISQSGAPIFFVLMPIGMMLLGVIIFAAIIVQSRANKARRAEFQALPPTFDFSSPAETTTTSSTSDPVVYRPPVRCPHCGAPLSDETVEWVGPLQIMCPSCGHTVDAEKKQL